MRAPLLSRIAFLALGILFLGASVCALPAEEYSLRFYDDSDGLSHWRTTRTLQDSTGMIWIATYNGLNRFDGYRFVAFKAADEDGLSMSSDRIRRLRLTEDNHLLCLIDDHVVRFNTRTCRFEALPDSTEAVSLANMQMRRNPDLWREKEVYTDLGNLHLKNIRRDYKDRQGNHWLIDDHGVYVATPVRARGTRINKEDVRAMIRLRNGYILASARSSKQIMVYDSAFHLVGYVHPNGHLSRQAVSFGEQPYCFFESRNSQRLWTGCKPGCLLETENQKIKRHEQVRNVYEIAEDSNGTIWAATYGFGLWKQQGGTFVQIPGTEEMSIRRLLITEDNTVLAATTTGLLVLDKKGLHLHQREGNRSSSLSSNAVMCICQHGSHLYVGTEGGGINRMIGEDLHADKLEFEHITHDNGLASDIIYDIMPWSENELLVQCNSALSIISIQHSAISIQNFGKSFFQTPDKRPFITGETWPIDLGDGRILIAPMDGMLVLDKSELVPEKESVRIALSTIYLEGKTNYAVDELTQITLAANERSMGLQFAALDYRGNEDIHYKTRFYKEGKKDQPWEAPTKIGQVLFQDLSPGEYVFEVRSTNALGQWQDNTRRLFVTVTPTFWESTAGLMLLIGLLLLIAVIITLQTYRVRTHRKQREETLNAYLDLQEKMRLIANSQEPGQTCNREPLPIPEILAPGRLSKDEEFLNTLHKWLEENMDNSEAVIDDLADRVCMSRSSLNRKMHDLFNLSAKDFLQAARIKHASQLLRTTDMAAKEVAYSCGFTDPKYFAKCFKSSTGQTPTEYRTQAENGE